MGINRQYDIFGAQNCQNCDKTSNLAAMAKSNLILIKSQEAKKERLCYPLNFILKSE